VVFLSVIVCTRVLSASAFVFRTIGVVAGGEFIPPGLLLEVARSPRLLKKTGASLHFVTHSSQGEWLASGQSAGISEFLLSRNEVRYDYR